MPIKPGTLTPYTAVANNIGGPNARANAIANLTNISEGIAIHTGRSIQTYIHELGHALAHLGDEYDALVSETEEAAAALHVGPASNPFLDNRFFSNVVPREAEEVVATVYKDPNNIPANDIQYTVVKPKEWPTDTAWPLPWEDWKNEVVDINRELAALNFIKSPGGWSLPIHTVVDAVGDTTGVIGGFYSAERDIEPSSPTYDYVSIKVGSDDSLDPLRYEIPTYTDWYFFHPTVRSLMNWHEDEWRERDPTTLTMKTVVSTDPSVNYAPPLYPFNLELWLKETYQAAGAIENYLPRAQAFPTGGYQPTYNEALQVDAGSHITLKVRPMIQPQLIHADLPMGDEGECEGVDPPIIDPTTGEIVDNYEKRFRSNSYFTKAYLQDNSLLDTNNNITDSHKSECMQYVRWFLHGEGLGEAVELTGTRHLREITVDVSELRVGGNGNRTDVSIAGSSGNSSYTVQDSVFTIEARVEEVSGRIKSGGAGVTDSSVMWQVTVQ